MHAPITHLTLPHQKSSEENCRARENLGSKDTKSVHAVNERKEVNALHNNSSLTYFLNSYILKVFTNGAPTKVAAKVISPLSTGYNNVRPCHVVIQKSTLEFTCKIMASNKMLPTT